MEINCALCFRDENGTFFINAYITLLSVFKNTKENVVAHILHDETITAEGKNHLKTLCETYGHDIRFHRVPGLDPHAASVLSQNFNLGALYRYFIHDFVNAPRAVYLDCDVIVNRDIAELYGQPLDKRLIAGTSDYSPYWKDGRPRKKYRETIDFLNLKPELYINSGVLLMNLDRLRELSKDGNILLQKTLDAVSKGIPLPCPDMDIINSLIASEPDGLLLLEDSFNMWRKGYELGLEELQGKIMHFVLFKTHNCLFPAHLLFWKFYAVSPFAGDMIERMSKAYRQSGPMDFVINYILKSKRRRHAAEFLKYGVLGMLISGVIRKLKIRKNKKGRRIIAPS